MIANTYIILNTTPIYRLDWGSEGNLNPPNFKIVASSAALFRVLRTGSRHPTLSCSITCSINGLRRNGFGPTHPRTESAVKWEAMSS
jgi:hypothetical protein